MSWADKVQIETPEQIDLDLEPAGPGARFYAQFIDWVIKGLVLFAVLLLVIFLTAVTADKGRLPEPNYYVLAVCAAAVFLFVFGYDVYYEGCRNGQTPGKYAAGLRVVREGGGPIDVRAACIRNLVGLADFLPTCYLLGGVVALLHKRGQRLGDLAAGTLVIRERATEAPDDLEPQILARAGTAYQFQAEQLDRCHPEDPHILRAFFARCDQLDRPSRLSLAFKLLSVYLERTAYVPVERIVDPPDAEAVLAALYRDLKTHRAHS